MRRLKKLFAGLGDGYAMVWLNAGALALSLVAVVGLIALIGVRGLAHFWPSPVAEFDLATPGGPLHFIGELDAVETVPASRLTSLQPEAAELPARVDRWLVKVGNRDRGSGEFIWVLASRLLAPPVYPADIWVFEREEWGNFYGRVLAVLEDGREVATGEAAWPELRARFVRARQLHGQALAIRRDDMGELNYRLEQVRLRERRLEQRGGASAAARDGIEATRAAVAERYLVLERQLDELRRDQVRDQVRMQMMDGRTAVLPLAGLWRIYRPNAMSVWHKLGFYVTKVAEFLSGTPREANTEGGVFPALFGTVVLVLLMSIFVVPFGVVAALYLREYAHQGVLTRTIRIAVNNLAGVPSIVYGVFGLGFFVYFVGGGIDRLFYGELLPSPTFGTPGLLWSSLTLALLTLPVVIVSTEEGLTRIPATLREGSLALGATRFETLLRVVLPMASPAVMTGLILGIARAAGEVAPLMLVGVVKLAPALPVDGNPPFFHLERKFMHLGFHIYDLGFQSPNVEAARSLVYATAFLLVVIIVLLNFSAIIIRNRLRENYRVLEAN